MSFRKKGIRNSSSDTFWPLNFNSDVFFLRILFSYISNRVDVFFDEGISSLGAVDNAFVGITDLLLVNVGRTSHVLIFYG